MALLACPSVALEHKVIHLKPATVSRALLGPTPVTSDSDLTMASQWSYWMFKHFYKGDIDVLQIYGCFHAAWTSKCILL